MAFILSSTPSTGRVHTLAKLKLKKTIIKSVMADQAVSVRPMNGGNGSLSYSQNSSFQRKAIEAAKELINKSITQQLDIKDFSSLTTFNIADLGCSVGPNTLLAVQNIIDAFAEKFLNDSPSPNNKKLPQFQVFFSDQPTNDFNQLFISLPPNTQYFAAGVPGSFYDRLFPDNSLQFVHSSCASQWLSTIPEEVLDESSPAWNKGRVHYSNSSPEVIKAFGDQFNKDLGKFLELRAEEIVGGGFLALILPGRPNGMSHSKAFINHAFEQLESALIDMAKEDKIKEDKIDSFNVAQYFASLEEVESIVNKNGSFKIEAMEIIPHEKAQPQVMSNTLRAGMEGTIKEHFGEEILDELFDIKLLQKFQHSVSITDSCDSVGLFVLLKRIEN